MITTTQYSIRGMNAFQKQKVAIAAMTAVMMGSFDKAAKYLMTFASGVCLQ